MKYSVIVSGPAKDAFKEIHTYVKREFGKKAADELRTKYKRILNGLAANPFMFALDVSRRPGVRKCSSLTPTIIYYEIQGTSVQVLYLSDGRKQVHGHG